MGRRRAFNGYLPTPNEIMPCYTTDQSCPRTLKKFYTIQKCEAGKPPPKKAGQEEHTGRDDGGGHHKGLVSGLVSCVSASVAPASWFLLLNAASVRRSYLHLGKFVIRWRHMGHLSWALSCFSHEKMQCCPMSVQAHVHDTGSPYHVEGVVAFAEHYAALACT